MSLQPPRIPMPGGSDLEKEKARLAMFPQFPFPFTPVTSSSSVFPAIPMFPPALQQVYQQLLQQQFLIAQQQQQSPQMRNDASPSLSDRASSREEESPNCKKLRVDEEGCAICPVCAVKLPLEEEWTTHVDEERHRLQNAIRSVKEQTGEGDSATTEAARRKREGELARIRANQAKRIALKRTVLPSSSLTRDSLTPFSRQSNDDSGSTASPEVKREEGNVKCAACQRMCDYGLVSSSFEQPRCRECFDAARRAPATPASPVDMRINVAEIFAQAAAAGSYSPPEKRHKSD